MTIPWICAECGKPTDAGIFLQTGRVLIEGVDAGQDVYLCQEHKPQGEQMTPTNCKRVSFYFPAPLASDRCTKCGYSGHNASDCEYPFPQGHKQQQCRDKDWSILSNQVVGAEHLE